MMKEMVIGITSEKIIAERREGVAYLPLTVSSAKGIRGRVLTFVRRAVFWRLAIPRSTESKSVTLINPPQAAAGRIAALRARLGLKPAIIVR